MKTEAPSVAEVAPFPCDVCGAVLDADHLEPGDHGAVCAFCGAEQGDRRPTRLRAPDQRTADLCETLRTAREDRGESLEQVARATSIRETYLQALEEGGSSFEPYPGRVYGRFFLREYAEHLGLQPEPLLRAFDRDGEPVLSEPPGPIGRRQPHPRRWAIGAALVLFAALVGGALLRRPTPAALSPSNPPATVSSAPTPTRSPVVPPRLTGVHAVITISAPSWVQASVDGRAVIAGETLPPGRVVRLNGSRRVDLTLGNAGGVRLVVNGRRFATGGSGDVLRVSFAWRDGRLVRL